MLCNTRKRRVFVLLKILYERGDYFIMGKKPSKPEKDAKKPDKKKKGC